MPDPLYTPRELRDLLSLEEQLATVEEDRLFLKEKLFHIQEKMVVKVQDQLKRVNVLLDDEKTIYEEISEVQKTISEQRTKFLYAQKNLSQQAAEVERNILIANEKTLEILLAKQKEIRIEYDRLVTTLERARGLTSKFLESITGTFFHIFPKLKEFESAIARLSDDAGEGMFSTKFWVRFGIIFSVFMFSATKLFSALDAAAAKFRKDFGMFRKDAENIKNSAVRIAVEFAGLGVNIENAYASFKALSSIMGGVHNVTQDLAKTTTLLAVQLGVSEEATAGVLKNMAFISKSTVEAQKSAALFVAKLSQVAGVEVDEVMKDISKLSSTALSMISRIPLQLTKAAVEAKRLGVSINEVARASREILNFSENINAEMDASVLLGKSINLQHARELAYRKDIAGSNREILKIANEIDFENLDVFQMEAFARATGRSVEELSKMVQSQREINKARNSDDPRIRKQVELYDQLKNASKDIAMTESERLEKLLQIENNQSRNAALSAKWKEVMMRLSDAFFPILDVFTSMLPYIIEIGLGLTTIHGSILAFMAPINKLFQFFDKTATVAIKFKSAFEYMKGFTFWIEKVFKAATPFLKWLGPLGLIVSTLQFIYELTKSWNEFVAKDGLILGGLKAIGYALYRVLIGPFVDAFNWIMKKLGWGAESPSGLGLSIVKGIASVGAMLYDVLTYPFRKAMSFITGLFGFNDLSKKIEGGLSGMLKDRESVEKEITAKPLTVPVLNVTPQEITPTISSPDTNKVSDHLEQSNTQTKSTNDTLLDILTAINSLNSNLESGKIGIYIDGQLLNATLHRQTEFRKGYGVNNIT